MSSTDLDAILADPDAAVWLYYDSRNTQRGLVSENDIKWMIAADQVNTQTFGWCPGLTEWVRLSEHPKLMQHFMTLSSIDEPWFYMDPAMRKQGPIELDLLTQMYAASQLSDETLTWTTGQISTFPFHCHCIYLLISLTLSLYPHL
jgi:hypothetical protein